MADIVKPFDESPNLGDAIRATGRVGIALSGLIHRSLAVAFRVKQLEQL